MTDDGAARHHTIKCIEQCVTEHNKHHPGTLMFICIDWPDEKIHMLYRSCCGEQVQKKSYGVAEEALQNIYPFREVIWRHRR
jgi:hypothetical protein